MLLFIKSVAILIEQIENKPGKQDQKIELLFKPQSNIDKEESRRTPIGVKKNYKGPL